MARYLLKNGTLVTAENIKIAHENGTAVLCHSHGDGKTTTSLILDGEHYDTRGECYSVWDECWTTSPEHINQCYLAARF